MASTVDVLELTDAVCGKRVAIDSKFRIVHFGALFCFCSEACRGLFMLHPSRYASAAAARRAQAADDGPGTAARTQGVIGGSLLEFGQLHPQGLRGAPLEQPAARKTAWPEPDAEADDDDEYAAPEPAGAAAVEMPRSSAEGGSGGLFSSLLAWRERRFAAEVSRELLDLYRVVAANNPALIGRELYVRVLAARNGGDLVAAGALVDAAEQSFAIWPVSRALKFSDVVHYVAASEFLASRGRGRWIHADIKHVVASRIPRDL